MSYSIESITESIGARRMGNAPATIDWLLTDSRSLNFPEETLFFALTTKRNDGARYIADLYARGVRNFVLSEESFRLMDNGQLTIDNAMQRDDAQSIVNYLIVPNPLKALQKLAEQHRNRFQIPVIGITGSNGKTCLSEDALEIMQESENINKALSHKPFHPESDEYKRFLGQIVLKIDQLNGKYPYLDFQKEREICRIRLKA